MLDSLLASLQSWDGVSMTPEIQKALLAVKQDSSKLSIFGQACLRQQLSFPVTLGDHKDNALLYQVLCELDFAFTDFCHPYFHLEWRKTLNRWDADWLNLINIHWACEHVKDIAFGIDWTSKEVMTLFKLPLVAKPLWFLERYGQPDPNYSLWIKEPKQEFFLKLRGKA